MCPIHDTNLNAAYIAGLLAVLGDVAASYSYWTFGDVFEELGAPSRPFHGGFGMIANGLIPKPTMWTFAFFNNLKGTPVYRDEHAVIVRGEDGSYEGVLWNLCRGEKATLNVQLDVPLGEYTLLTRTVDEETCNPLKVWHEMGQPASLNAQQLAFLRGAGLPQHASRRIGGRAEITLGPNAVVHFSAKPCTSEQEYGYDYEWYRAHC